VSVLAETALAEVLHEIALGAAERDRAMPPTFPYEAFDALGRAGVLAWGVQAGARRPPALEELALVRRVAAADGAVGRILDGHLNALERLAVQAPPEVRERELDAVLRHGLRAGVWGADPVGEEGEPAAVHDTPGGLVLRGVKVFCSGAGGVQRALVLARDAANGGPPLAAWVDAGDRERVEVDPTWFRGAGLRASVSHRVVFHDAPLIALLGGPGALSEQPWFARDALRTAASWAGMADTAVTGALDELAARARRGQLEELAAGRIATAQRTIDLWIRQAACAMDAARDDDGAIEPLRATSIHARDAIASACRTLLDEAARACGSRPFATAGSLDRARRDLELFLLQHRLDPLLARAGAERLDGR
jgi:hypothetical protein